jgi:hypothetical protein
MAMSVAEADRILEELPPLKRGLAVQLRVVEAILRAHSAEVPPDEVDARMARIAKAFHGRSECRVCGGKPLPPVIGPDGRAWARACGACTPLPRLRDTATA